MWLSDIFIKFKVVIAELKSENKSRMKSLLSTELEMKARDVFLIYRSRFQIEFLYRDANRTPDSSIGSPLMPIGSLSVTMPPSPQLILPKR